MGRRCPGLWPSQPRRWSYDLVMSLRTSLPPRPHTHPTRGCQRQPSPSRNLINKAEKEDKRATLATGQIIAIARALQGFYRAPQIKELNISHLSFLKVYSDSTPQRTCSLICDGLKLAPNFPISKDIIWEQFLCHPG